MPRRRRLRRVLSPPHFKGYRPYGNARKSSEAIELLFEEYEALKLADYDFMNHQEASELMNISRPTFARIYESARRKLAKALVESKEIRTAYGHVYFDKDWYVCGACHARFNKPQNTDIKQCPLCRSENVKPITE